ncbi:uncharacterized protein [Dermacentor albipictus]|uniref:uncharacterized protein n=1 Tax=Dermacentor albipictus TaxID=60249 RepID=UPI0038FCB145
MDLRAVEGQVEIDGTPIVRLTWTGPGAHMTHGVGNASGGCTARDPGTTCCSLEPASTRDVRESERPSPRRGVPRVVALHEASGWPAGILEPASTREVRVTGGPSGLFSSTELWAVHLFLSRAAASDIPRRPSLDEQVSHLKDSTCHHIPDFNRNLVTRDLRWSDVPPAKIMDLRAVEGHVENDGTPIVRLTWTWPGTHMTHGVVSSNELPIRPAPANYTFKDTLLGDLEPTRPFQRITGGASFKVTRDLRRSDVPPANIMDLRAVEGHVEIDGTPIVRLTWTGPGAHITHGVVS